MFLNCDRPGMRPVKSTSLGLGPRYQNFQSSLCDSNMGSRLRTSTSGQWSSRLGFSDLGTIDLWCQIISVVRAWVRTPGFQIWGAKSTFPAVTTKHVSRDRRTSTEGAKQPPEENHRARASLKVWFHEPATETWHKRELIKKAAFRPTNQESAFYQLLR